MPLEDEKLSATPPSAKLLRDAAAGAYAQGTAIRAAIQAIPYVGGPLDTLLAGKGQEIERERIIAMFNFLAEETRRLDESTISREWLASEKAHDVLSRAVNVARRSRGEDRLRVLARVLRGSITAELEVVADAEDIIDALGSLNDEQLQVLQAGFEILGEDATAKPFWQTQLIAARLPEPVRPRLAFNLHRISHTGILQEATGAMVGYAGGGYHLTVVGQNLQRFLTKSVE